MTETQKLLEAASLLHRLAKERADESKVLLNLKDFDQVGVLQDEAELLLAVERLTLTMVKGIQGIRESL